MKKIIFLLALLCASSGIIMAQKTFVPDDIFESYLIQMGWDDVLDDSVLTTSISGRASVDVSYKGIYDLTGIEDFVALQILHCENNNISSLDVSNASGLRQLYCSNNSLTSLDVSQNTALELLSCYYNDITLLNVNLNVALTNLTCSYNTMSKLYVDGAIELTTLMCDHNQIKILDLSHNTKLKTLNCQYNQLIKLDVQSGNNATLTSFNARNNTSLSCIEVDDALAANSGDLPYTWWSKDPASSYSEDCILPTIYVPDDNFEAALIALGFDNDLDDYVYAYEIADIESLDISDEAIVDLTGIEGFTSLGQLNCSNNQLTSLDLSQNTSLTYLNCADNVLTSLNIRNGNNSILTSFDASNNSSLTCIQVDDEIKAISGLAPYTLWIKDPGSSYSADCSLAGVKIYVPDDRFEQLLIDYGWDIAPLDDSVRASVISTITTLDVSSSYIQDLTGIEGFINLVSLNCVNNILTSLDLSQNTALETILCYTNQLASLDVSNNIALKSLNCTNNLLQRLVLTENSELVALDCQNNQIDSLNVNSNLKLESLICRKNKLMHLDLSNNSSLERLDCFDNLLTNLDVHNKTSLNYLDCSSNQISNLNISGAKIYTLKCYYNQLTQLDISTNYELGRLECHNNQLSSIDLSGKTYLWLIICNDNLITSLDLKDNTALIDFVCHHNLLTELDMTKNTLMGSINCSNNQISSPIDLSSCPDLLSANISNNPVEELILASKKKNKAANDLNLLNISNTLITSIDILNNSGLDHLDVHGIPLDSLDVSGNTSLSYLNTTSTNLDCIQVNQVQLNNIPGGWVKDVTTVYSIDCNSTTLIENEIFNESVCIYPNPADNIVYIESEKAIRKVEIHSITGMKLLEKLQDCKSIPVEYLPPGVYLMRIESDRAYTVKRFTKKQP